MVRQNSKYNPCSEYRDEIELRPFPSSNIISKSHFRSINASYLFVSSCIITQSFKQHPRTGGTTNSSKNWFKKLLPIELSSDNTTSNLNGMASLSLLANDYLALAKEAGRRHSEVKEVSKNERRFQNRDSEPIPRVFYVSLGC